MAAAAGTKKFSWTSELIDNLIKSLSNYKIRMEFMNKEFNGDKPRQYEEIRKDMARIYSSVDIKMFGPESVMTVPREMDVSARVETLEMIKGEQQYIKWGVQSCDGKDKEK